MPTPEFRGKSGAGYYGDFVAQVDNTVGRVMNALADAQLTGNTVLIFTSDNGAHWLPEDIAKWKHRANDGWRGQKADIWDGGHRVPLIARWPAGIAAGANCDALVSLNDLFATAVRLAGATPPPDAGPDSVDKYGRRVPPYLETMKYVQRIAKTYAKLKSDAAGPTDGLSLPKN